MPDLFNTCDKVAVPPGVVTVTDVASGYMVPQPKIYRELSSGVTLTTSWQRLDLATLVGGASGNSFAGTSPNKLVDWNPTSKLLTFNSGVTQNYIATLNAEISTAGILLTPIVAPIKINFRFVVPDGNGPGSDYYFPFSTRGGYMDLHEVAWNGQMNVQRQTPITSDAPKRATGVGCDVKLSSNPLTGSISFSGFSIYMFGN